MSRRVALITDLFPPAICGIGDYSYRLATALSEEGAEVAVITKRLPGVQTHTVTSGFHVYRFITSWAMADFLAITRVLRALGPETVVHLQYPSKTGYHRRVMINLLPALLRVLRKPQRVVVTLHEFHERSSMWRVRVLPMLAFHDAIIFVREIDRAAASSWLWPSVARSAVIPIGSNIPVAYVDEEARQLLRQELGFRSDQSVVVFFGTVYPDKGVPLLLDAVDHALSNGVDLGLLMIGDIGNELQPPNQVKLNVTEHQRGVISRMDQMLESGVAKLAVAPAPERVSELLSAGDLAVFPFVRGASENRGSLLAAIEHGLPVLTTRGPSTPEGFEQRFGVHTVPAGDADALSTALAAMLSRDSAKPASRSQQSITNPTWSWSQIARQTLRVYERLHVVK